MDAQTVEIAALGRPLHPGMLYNCLTDTFIPGVSLWDQEAIKEDLNVEAQPHMDVVVAASDSFSEKTKLIDVGASLKASFLAGLVKVVGSAGYLKDRVSSTRQCRVTMRYRQMTEFKQLTMTQLGHVTFPEVFEKKNATHVVTAAKYGAEAYMVFEQTVSDEEDKQEIKGNLEAMIKKIPTIDIGGSGKVGLTDEEKKKVEAFSCTFHGDFTLEQNPTTYEEAVLVYKQLPKLLGDDGSKAVPVRVWLYPLKNLDSKAAQLVREIGVELVELVGVRLDQLHEIEMRASDAIRRSQAIQVNSMTDKLVTFKKSTAVYAEILQHNLRKVLPAIRAGAEEQKLIDILQFHHDSSFFHDKLRKWLDEKESEIGLLEGYINPLIPRNVQIVLPGPELNSILLDPSNTHVYILSFSSLAYEEPYLSNLLECLACEEFKKMEETSVAEDLSFKEETLPWFKEPKISERMRSALTSFQSKLRESALLQLVTSAKFIISYISDPSCPGAALLTYKNGELQDQKDADKWCNLI